MRHVAAAMALAQATVRDGVRRPAFVVGVLLFGGLLGVIPHLGNPAAGTRDNRALAVELTVSSLLLGGSLVAGVLGVRAVQGGHGSGWATELVSAPVSRGASLLGRWMGSSAIAAALCLAALAIGAVGWIPWSSAGLPSQVTPWTSVTAGAAGATLLGAALGIAYGMLVGGDLAVLLLLVHVLCARWTQTSADSSLAAALLPDPSRVDSARDFAFGGDVGGSFVLLSTVGALLQCAALLALACAVPRTRGGVERA